MTNKASLLPATSLALVIAAASTLTGPAVAQFVPPPVVQENTVNAIQQVVDLTTIHAPQMQIKKGATGAVKEMRFDAASAWMIMRSADGMARLWNMELGREEANLSLINEAISAVAVNDTADRFVIAGEKGSLQVLSGDKLSVMAEHSLSGAVRLVIFEGKSLAAVLSNGDIVRLNAGTGAIEETVTLPVKGKIRAAMAGADGKLLAKTADNRVELLSNEGGEWKSARSMELSGFFSKPKVQAFTLAADGDAIFVSDNDGKLWASTAEKTKPHELLSLDASITAINKTDKAGQFSLADANGGLHLVDAASGKVIKSFAEISGQAFASLSLTGSQQSLATDDTDSSGGWQMVAADEAGVMHFFDLEEQKETAKAASLEDGWVVVNDDGLFDGEGTAFTDVHWGNDETDASVAVDQMTDEYYQPGLLALAVDGEVEPATTSKSIKEELKLPPKIEIRGDIVQEADEQHQMLTIAGIENGNDIKEVILFQNGKRIEPEEAEVLMLRKIDEPTEMVKRVPVVLTPGENVFMAIAKDANGVESNPVEVKITLKSLEAKSTLHVVTIGINEYENPALNLNYGVPDARGIQQFFETQSNAESIFRSIQTHTLYNKDVTKQNVLALLDSLKDLPSEDTVIVYFAGHGETVGDDWYFVPHELKFPEDEEEMVEHGIHASLIQDKLVAMNPQKIVMLMDACKSGAALARVRGFTERKAIKKLARSTGTHMVAAAGQDQFATELPELGHGIFTYTLLEALKGKADSGDGMITVRELISYAEDRIPELSRKAKAQPQFPVVDSRGQDFPLALKRKAG